MATVYDVEAQKLIEQVAKELSNKDNLKAPDWSRFVKTGPSKDRVPLDADWWYVRSAAVLRTMYKANGPLGVQKLRIKYGSKKNRGHKPEKFYKSSGKIIRTILQSLEKEGLIQKADIGVHKGRVISGKGKSLLDKSASALAGKPAKKPVGKPVKKQAEKPAKNE
ncbi:30S ribosomal protein S19e [Candidatus Woesearchaeota archaeon]|nr:30S ribosomal protein S19e [Candidatus Woesearchaeota archaeon]